MDSESGEKGVEEKDLAGVVICNVISFFSKWRKTSVLSGAPCII